LPLSYSVIVVAMVALTLGTSRYHSAKVAALET
jgi:hypothetical protein